MPVQASNPDRQARTLAEVGNPSSRSRQPVQIASPDNVAAAGAVDRELVDIFLDLLSFGAENALTEGREGFTKVPGGRRIRSGRV